MRQVWISRKGGPEVLEVREARDPEPAPGQLRVRTEFAGVNFAEVMARTGLYPDAPPVPFVPGYELSGRVDAVGEGVDPAWLDRRVTAVTRFGGYADTVLLSPGLAVPTPDEVPDHVAAALPVNGLTAHHMVHRVCAVRSGETVLVHGAAGGVGTIAVQLCRRAGARVIGTASPSKHDLLKDEGVEPVDSRAADWEERVRALTDGRGVDVALDPIGGSHLRRSYGLLRPAGRLCAFGVQEMSAGRGGARRLWTAVRTLVAMPWFHPVKLMNENRSVGGVNLGRLWDETELLAPQLRAVTGLAASGELRPVIDSVFALDRAADAHRRLESRESAGKILLKARVGEGTDYR